MSALVCPHCCREFSGEQMAKFIEDVAGQKRLNQLKDTFMKENGWGAKENNLFKLMLVGMFFFLALYVVIGVLFIKVGGDEMFARYFGLLLATALGGIFLWVVVLFVVGYEQNKKADKAFNEWRLISGN